MSKQKYKYSVHGDIDSLYTLETIWDEDDADYIAADCGQNYYREHDGWEVIWPIEVTIWTLRGRKIGLFSVELEHEPTFSARPLKSTAALAKGTSEG